jgi:aspartyl protease family protein
MKLWILLGVMAAALLAAVIAGDDGSIGGLATGQFMSFVLLATMLAFVGFSLLSQYGGRLGTAVRDALIWVGLALALVLGYSYRDEFRGLTQRITGELMPPGDSMSVASTGGEDRAVRIRKRADGHFVARGDVNGANMTLLVDTGASTVVLKPTDARAAGINVDTLSYTVPVRTANGTAYAAAVRIKRVSVGGITVDGVEALVAKPGTLTESLLGMSFLTRLRSYEFSGDFLTLRS